jgi:hypothetical protein
MCRFVIWGFVTLYGCALAIFLIGNFGLFGTQADPLASVYLVIMGQPWNQLVDFLPEALWPWAATAAPMLTVALLVSICRFLASSIGRGEN